MNATDMSIATISMFFEPLLPNLVEEGGFFLKKVGEPDFRSGKWHDFYANAAGWIRCSPRCALEDDPHHTDARMHRFQGLTCKNSFVCSPGRWEGISVNQRIGSNSPPFAKGAGKDFLICTVVFEQNPPGPLCERGKFLSCPFFSSVNAHEVGG